MSPIPRLTLSLPESFRAVYILGRRQIEIRQLPLDRPAPGEILVRVDAATTCGTDLKVFKLGGHPRMLKVPSPFGHEMAGTIAAIGPGDISWRVGDRVVVVNSSSCGRCEYCRQDRENLCTDLQYLNGAFAEFLLVPPRFVERSTYSIPANLSAPEAALVEPLACVLHGIEACQVSEPTSILVLGAGPVGLLLVGALSVAGHAVTAVDSNESRRHVAFQMGATTVMDREEFAQKEVAFELSVDATGTLGGWNQAIAATAPGGQILFFGGCPPGSRLELDTGRLHYDELTLRGAYHHKPAAVGRALSLLSKKSFPAATLLTSRLPLEQTEEALRSMMRRQNLKVVLEP